MLSDASLTFLSALLEAPGPSGFEAAPARLWRAEAEHFADEVHADVSGNSYASLQAGPNPGAAPLMLAGHIDEIGLMVVHIDEQGYLWFETIGGWDRQVLVGQRVTLLGRQGPVPGVIGKPAVHLIEKEDREKLFHLLRPSRSGHRTRVGAAPLHAHSERAGRPGGPRAHRAAPRGFRAQAHSGLRPRRSLKFP